MIVVDLGCAHQAGMDSLFTLWERFSPDILYGFDPLWTAEMETPPRCVIRPSAAWTFDGRVMLGTGAWGMDATLMKEKAGGGEWEQSRRVPCFDFSRWLRDLGVAAVVKMDIEGAEYLILSKMIEDGTDRLMSLLLVEWHDDKMPGMEPERLRLLSELACEVEGW